MIHKVTKQLKRRVAEASSYQSMYHITSDQGSKRKTTQIQAKSDKCAFKILHSVRWNRCANIKYS